MGTAPAGAAPPASASVADRVLVVTGSNGPDDIRVSAPDASEIVVDLDGDGAADARFARAAVDALRVALGNGADRFSAVGVILPGPSTIDGGNGDDIVVGTGGPDVINGANGADVVAGGPGTDTGVLDRGDDSFLWDPGDGSDRVDGGSGDDTMRFNGAGGNEVMRLSPAGAGAVFVRSPGNIRMDLDGVERLDVRALGGDDGVTVDDLRGTALRLATVDLSAAGDGLTADGQTDQVTVNGTPGDDRIDVVADGARVDVGGLQATTAVVGSDPTDRLQVAALEGDDLIDVDPRTATLIDVVVDLGSGQR
jgi:hypothetical protein